MHDTQVRYLVLEDVGDPYLLARVRWPDVFQAMSPQRPEWQEDPGLFDLPYEPTSREVSFDDARAIATRWGADPEIDESVLTCGTALIRRMPANWSSLAPAERRAWSLDPHRGRRRRPAPDRAEVDEAAAPVEKLGEHAEHVEHAEHLERIDEPASL